MDQLPTQPVASTRHVRAQTYAAELTPEQVAGFVFCNAGVTWFWNQAAASQLDRYRHHVPVESGMSLSYAVSAARMAGVEFPCNGRLHPVADVPAVMLHGALRQLSAGWTRHLKAVRAWRDRPHPAGAECPSNAVTAATSDGDIYHAPRLSAGTS